MEEVRFETAPGLEGLLRAAGLDSFDRAMASGLTRIRARRAAPVLMLYFRPAQALGKTATMALK